MDSLIALLGLLLTAAPQVVHVPSQETLQIRGSDIDDRSKYIATCRMYFETFDIDHRGYLTKRGLRRIISNSVLVPFPLIQVSFRAVDTNRDGRISEKEYIDYASKTYVELRRRRSAVETRIRNYNDR